MQHYDFAIITSVNSFYKVNLFNELSKHRSLFVVFSGAEDVKRSSDFYKDNMTFDHVFLPSGVLKLWELMSVIRKSGCKKIIISGWEYWGVLILLSFMRFKKVGCIIESSVNESKTRGLKAWVKQYILSKVDVIFASGELQAKLATELGFNGQIIKFGGCGILNYLPQPPYESRYKINSFLYVGRLVKCKNIDSLISVFNDMSPYNLTIVGTGPEELYLKSISKTNIHFVGSVDNSQISQYYKNSDVFVLPSKFEPWGLVVEEALNNGCPVIVSNMVGSYKDLVEKPNTGLIFDITENDGLRLAVKKMTNPESYNHFRENVSKMDFLKRAEYQVDMFKRF